MKYLRILLTFFVLMLPLTMTAQTNQSTTKKKVSTTKTAGSKKASNHKSGFSSSSDHKQSSTSSTKMQTEDDRIIQNLINNMVFVEGGSFTMGATNEQGSDSFDDEKPAHRVTVSSFCISKYEVTQAEWQVVMGNNPSFFKGNNLPVEQVSWDDCQEFIHKLNTITGLSFRLPTEAEWEYAARGGNRSRGYKYAGSNSLSSVAWFGDNSLSTTHAVGTKSPNELGIYDMSGNVWEWCQDWYYGGYYINAPKENPKGPYSGSYRINRGGSWLNNVSLCRVPCRINSVPSYLNGDLGLRLAL